MKHFTSCLGLCALALIFQPVTVAQAETPLELLMKKTIEASAKPAASPAEARPKSRATKRAAAAKPASQKVSRTVGADGAGVAAMIRREAQRQGIPANFAVAIARTESTLRCKAVGRHGELGPFQIKPATARGIGYTGPASALNSCGAGITWGIRHLAIGYRKCGSTTGAAALHNGGLGASCRSTAYTRRVASRY
jgi:soluble lytic murein transglycosylase-like protein